MRVVVVEVGVGFAGPAGPPTLTNTSNLSEFKNAYRRVLEYRGIDVTLLFVVDNSPATAAIMSARRQLPLPTSVPSEALDNAALPLPPLSFLPVIQAYCWYVRPVACKQ